MQFIFGFLFKLFPGASPDFAKWYRPIHNFMGAMVFCVACIAACMGVSLAGEYVYDTLYVVDK